MNRAICKNMRPADTRLRFLTVDCLVTLGIYTPTQPTEKRTSTRCEALETRNRPDCQGTRPGGRFNPCEAKGPGRAESSASSASSSTTSTTGCSTGKDYGRLSTTRDIANLLSSFVGAFLLTHKRPNRAACLSPQID